MDIYRALIESATSSGPRHHPDRKTAFAMLGDYEETLRVGPIPDDLSELTVEERAFALAQAYRLLEPGGLLLLADEVVPQRALRRALYTAVRVPLALLTYLLTQTTTRALADLSQQVERAGFVIQSYRLNRLHSFATVVARRPM